MGNASSQPTNAGGESFLTTAREPLLGLLDKLDESEDLEILRARKNESQAKSSKLPIGRSVVYKGKIPSSLLEKRGTGVDLNDDINEPGPRFNSDVSAMTTVAIKRLRLGEETGGRDEYWKEVRIMNDIQHPRVVQLLGCCSEKGEALLIYEFMEGGNLGAALFHPVSPQSVLTWHQRLVIAMDAARGLQFLNDQQIIHRDFRPANVFLDKIPRAKVGGLSSAYVSVAGNIPPPDQKVAGRIGYVCTNYLETGYISPKLDVFSFGITLLQLLAGRMAVQTSAISADSVSLAEVIERPSLGLLPPEVLKAKEEEALEESALDRIASLSKIRELLAAQAEEEERQKAAKWKEEEGVEEAKKGEVDASKKRREKKMRGADAYHKLDSGDDDMAVSDKPHAELGGEGGKEGGVKGKGNGESGGGSGGGGGGEGGSVGHGMIPQPGGARRGAHWALKNEEGGGDVAEFEEGGDGTAGAGAGAGVGAEVVGEVNCLADLMDPRLRGEWDEEVARKLLALAATCVQRKPSRRPYMGEVADELQRIVDEDSERG